MGLYDREYYRDEDEQSGYAPSANWSMTTRLIVVNAVVFFLNLIIVKPGWLMDTLGATPESLTRPYLWWQLLTYGFAHDTEGIQHIFWNMFGLWVFGRSVEAIYGSKEFLRIYLAAIVLGGLFWAARTLAMSIGEGTPLLVGASGAVTAVTLLFCIHYPKQTILLMLVLPVPAWFIGAVIIIGNVMGAIAGAGNVAVDVHLVGAAFAVVYYKFGLNLGRWTPNFSSPGKWFKSKPRLRVHHEFDDEGEPDDNLAREADRLLDKINREGIDSLSKKERRILEQHSRRVRDRRH